MAVAALEFAGLRFVPDDSRLKVMRDYSAGCGNLAGLDSTMLVSMLQGGGSVSQAARFLLHGLLAHACDGGCRPAPRRPPAPVGSPPHRLAPSLRPRPPQLNIRRRRPRRLLRRRPSATVVKVTLGQSCSRLRSVLPPRVSVQGRTLLPRRGRGSFPAMPSVALSFRVETLSLFGSSLSQWVFDGVFFWFLSRVVTSRSRGGARVLSSMTADAFAGAAVGKS